MGAKNSKAKRGDKVGVAGCDDSSDVVDKTATLPASFKQKEVQAASKTETLPRNLNRSTSFTNSCRNWAKKKGLVKDKSSSKVAEDAARAESEEAEKQNGRAAVKESLTPAVAKLAQKKARAQFFEEMYNSSGISVSSGATPDKPKRLGEINLPSPRIGPGSPAVEEKAEGKVEHLTKQIEEKEALNRSLESDGPASLGSFPRGGEAVAEAVAEEVREDLVEAAKEEDAGVEVTGLLKVQEILEGSVDAGALDETLPSHARLEQVATQFAQESAQEATQEEMEDEHQEEEEEQVEEEKEQEELHGEDTKEKVDVVGEVNDVSETEAGAAEPSSLESVGSDEENTKAVESSGEAVEEGGEDVINTAGDSSGDEGGASTDEGYDEQKEQGGAEGLRKALKDDSADVDDEGKLSSTVEDD